MTDFEKNVALSLTDIQNRLAVLQAGVAVTTTGVQHILANQLSLDHDKRKSLIIALNMLRSTHRKEHPAFIQALHQMIDAWIEVLMLAGDQK